MASFGDSSLLLTDLYEFTMLQAYLQAGMRGRATFELFVRKLPPQRRFLVVAGLDHALEFLESARFASDELAWLEQSGRFDRSTLASLAEWRFRGDVDAMPEGTVAFADEPLLRVDATIAEAQVVETRLLNLVHFATVAASKAVRYRLAAPQQRLLDFGLRRAQGGEAGLLAARAAFIGGFDGTATLAAEQRFGVPAFGTMAHSFVQAHDDELEAFRQFARACPSSVVLLIDTYDALACAKRLPKLVKELAVEGLAVHGVRLDSGDLGALAREVRSILDHAGCEDLRIYASGGLDEHRVRTLAACNAPIDGFGVGTDLTTSADCPALDAAYKLVAYDGRPTCKWSPKKVTWPAPKQVVRRRQADGTLAEDRLALLDDEPEGLLIPVMRNGRRLEAAESLTRIRSRAQAEVSSLPPPLRDLAPGPSQEVAIDARLQALAASLQTAASRQRCE